MSERIHALDYAVGSIIADGRRMAVCVGTSDARRFGNKTYPLGHDAKTGQKWNSLFVKDASHITAISSATVNGQNGIWAIDGKILQFDNKP